MLIMGPIHIIYSERIGRFNKRWYDAMPFNGLVATYTDNTYRKMSIFSWCFYDWLCSFYIVCLKKCLD